ncbi:MAG: transporter substrate-binding domain-containing protein [Geminicoccales bacterium]
MRALLLAAFVSWVGMTPSSGTAADWSSIKIGTEGTFPPWNATNGDGEVIGFEIDLAQDLCRRMGARCHVITQKWNGMIPALATGKYDAIMAGMTVNEERERAIDFSRCYGNDPALFVVNRESRFATMPVPQDKVDLATLEPEDQAALHELRKVMTDAVIGTQIATNQADFMYQFFGDVADVQPFDTLESMTYDLINGRIDAVFLTKAAWVRLSESDDSAGLIAVGPDLAGGLLGQGVGVGIRARDADLRAMFDKAIAAAIADGTVKQLSERWFGYDLSC